MDTGFLFEVIDIILPDTKIIHDLKGKILESSNHDADRKSLKIIVDDKELFPMMMYL
jgi:hypothetical protein